MGEKLVKELSEESILDDSEKFLVSYIKNIKMFVMNKLKLIEKESVKNIMIGKKGVMFKFFYEDGGKFFLFNFYKRKVVF